MALPATYIHGAYTKTRIRLHTDGTIAIYQIRKKNTSSHPTFEVVNTKTGLYPQKYGVHLHGFTHLYDAERLYHDLVGKSPNILIAPIAAVGKMYPPPIKVDGKRRGGSHAGS